MPAGVRVYAGVVIALTVAGKTQYLVLPRSDPGPNQMAGEFADAGLV